MIYYKYKLRFIVKHPKGEYTYTLHINCSKSYKISLNTNQLLFFYVCIYIGHEESQTYNKDPPI